MISNKEIMDYMSLNWTPEIFFCAAATVGIVYALFATLRAIQRGNHYRYFTCMALTWGFWLLMIIFVMIGTLLLDPAITLMAIHSITVGNFFILLATDAISQEHINPWKVGVYALIAATVIFTTISPMSAFPIRSEIGFWTIGFTENVSIAIGLVFFYPIAFFLYVLARMYKEAPKNLKSDARLYLLGMIIAGPIDVSMIVIGVDRYFPGLNWLLACIGSILMAKVAARRPMLLFILPFKIQRLSIIDTASGISLFNHTWKVRKEIGTDELFSGMLQGISLILKETLGQGNVEEIRLTQGVMILQRSQQANIACVLVTSKSSRTLKDALKHFSDLFYQNYHQYFTTSYEIYQFEPAKQLVAECFPFVPEYD